MKSKINIAINLQPHHDKLTHILIIKWVIQIQVMQCKHVSVAQTQVTNDENNKSVDDNSQVNCSNKQSQISTINHVHKQINSPYSILYLHKSHIHLFPPFPPPHTHTHKKTICIGIVLDYSWDMFLFQEKLQTMSIQNFGGFINQSINNLYLYTISI